MELRGETIQAGHHREPSCEMYGHFCDLQSQVWYLCPCRLIFTPLYKKFYEEKLVVLTPWDTLKAVLGLCFACSLLLCSTTS